MSEEDIKSAKLRVYRAVKEFRDSIIDLAKVEVRAGIKRTRRKSKGTKSKGHRRITIFSPDRDIPTSPCSYSELSQQLARVLRFMRDDGYDE